MCHGKNLLCHRCSKNHQVKQRADPQALPIRTDWPESPHALRRGRAALLGPLRAGFAGFARPEQNLGQNPEKKEAKVLTRCSGVATLHLSDASPTAGVQTTELNLEDGQTPGRKGIGNRGRRISPRRTGTQSRELSQTLRGLA